MSYVRVRRSRLTGHWIVNPGNPHTAQGFRRWDDAIAEANERALRLMTISRRLSGQRPA